MNVINPNSEIIFFTSHIVYLISKNSNMLILLTRNNVPKNILNIIDQQPVLSENLLNLLYIIDVYIESTEDIVDVI